MSNRKQEDNGILSRGARLGNSLRQLLQTHGRLLLMLTGVTVAIYFLFSQVLLSTRFFSYGTPDDDRWFDAEPGTMSYDLHGVDFDGIQARLRYSDLYYPEAILTPEEIDGVEPTRQEDVSPGTIEYATQRFIVRMPEETRAYKLYFYHITYASRVYVNGELAASSGVPGESLSEMTMGREPLICYAAPKDGVLDIVVQISSFHHNEDKVYLAECWITDANYEYDLTLGAHLRDYVIIGALAGFAVLLLGLFLTSPQRTENLYFALACLMMAARRGAEGDALTKLIPAISPDMTFLLFQLSTYIIPVCLVLYFNRIFPKMVPRWSRCAFYGISGIFMAAVFLTEPVFHTGIRKYYYFFLILCMAFFTVRLLLKLRRPTREQVVSLFGTILFFVTETYDMARGAGLWDLFRFPAKMSESIMTLFVFTQLVALFMGNLRVTAEARESERRIAAEKEALEQLNRLKTEFLSNVSHELKTPLAVMSSYAQQSQKALRDLPELREVELSMKRISSEASRLALMVTQVLDVSKIDEGRLSFNMRPRSIEEIIQNTLNTYAPLFSKNGNRLEFTSGEDLPEVLCDDVQIGRVLVNLLGNAARHTQGGVISVTAQEVDGTVCVTVADTGEGIPPELMPELFERFKTGKENARGGKNTGTGLGLFICKYIVEGHGGEIRVESEPGAGTRVSFTLPLRT